MDLRVLDLAAVMDAAGRKPQWFSGSPTLAVNASAPHARWRYPRRRPSISADLTRRGVQAPGWMPSLSDQGWLDLMHSVYYTPVRAAT
jgi:hypothetical protein